MARSCLRYLVLGLGGALILLGQGAEPDSEYLVLFREMKTAETAEVQGDRETACETFRTTQHRLLGFQRAFPTWHPEVVAFRLRHLEERVGLLCGEASATETNAAQPLAARVDSTGVSQELLVARLRQVEAEREDLKKRLREALAARPAMMDSPELESAESRIRKLEKEVALLRYASRSGQKVGPDGERQDGVDREAELRAEVQTLRRALLLEREKVAALEITASELGERLTQGGVQESPPTATEVERGPAPELLPERARSLLERGRFDEAIALLGPAAEAPDAPAGVLGVLGGAFLAKGMLQPAEFVALRALDVDGACAEAHQVMAQVCLRRSPPSRSLARWHYLEARRYGLKPDPELEAMLTDAQADSP